MNSKKEFLKTLKRGDMYVMEHTYEDTWCHIAYTYPHGFMMTLKGFKFKMSNQSDGSPIRLPTEEERKYIEERRDFYDKIIKKTKKMKQFKDLEFEPLPIRNGVKARMDFDNGYGVRVVKFNGSYGYPHLWEVAIMYDGSVTYSSGITEYVLGRQTDEDVTEIMRQVQELIK